MKLFTIDKDGKFVQFKEQSFQDDNKEVDLEILLENNPEYFFNDGKILVIGRQVTTNFNTFIDLLGVDKNGNTVTIELKRGKTPRETVAQILEYASFIENLDYDQLNEIFQNYSGEYVNLDEYHLQYFQNENQNVSFNKTTKLVIVAQDISPEIKQTALYLRKNGIEIYCVEFKYFVNKSNEKMISNDFVVGDEEFIKQKVKSASSLPKVDKQLFLSSLDKNGFPIFTELFNFAEIENLVFRWGSKGFSLNLPLENVNIGLCFGYPPTSVFKQSIYSAIDEIHRKINNPDQITEFYRKSLEKIGVFEPAKSNLKWVINKKYSSEKMKEFLDILKLLVQKIRETGLKAE